MIQKFNKINARTFKNFIPTGLPDFARYNLIYGWNGSGKTTISDILRMVEKRQSIGENGIGDFSFVYDGRTITNGTIASDQNPPQVRVFNRTFIDKNIFNDGAITPIFFIGEENIEKQKLLDRKKRQLKRLENYSAKRGTQKKNKEKELEQLCQGKASEVRAWLGITSQNSFHKGHFGQQCDLLLADANTASYQRSEAELEVLKTTINSNSKPTIDPIILQSLDLPKIAEELRAIIQKTVVSKTIAALTEDKEISSWVEDGLVIHKEHSSDTCLFCTQKLPVDRIQGLEAHFNAAYNTLIEQIQGKNFEVGQKIDALKNIQKIDESRFYDDLVPAYQQHWQQLDASLQKCIDALTRMQENLESKKSAMFTALTFEAEIPDSYDALALTQLNSVIEQHNQRSNNFSTAIDEAKKTIKVAFASACIDEYRLLKADATRLAEKCTVAVESAKTAETTITALEQDIISHKKPAEDINEDLCKYLGHKELEFGTVDGEAGYFITRNGQPANALSEGEKTAVALLHFLKSLEDRAFDLKQGIVVVDDPVCSLDDTALFYAFSYIKERTKEAKQLFILTHNFSFFRQVKNWFQHIDKHNKKPEKQKSRFYQTLCGSESGQRVSQLKELDALLKDYESEYHYLFKLVQSNADDNAGSDLAHYYHMPNVARRLLEAFLSFRFPSNTDGLNEKIKSASTDSAKTNRIVRFLHVNSHEEHQISPHEHDGTVLAEAPQILSDIINLIKEEDPRHYAEMRKLVPSQNTQSETQVEAA
jgi:wobble nucleotide-excising tRNase